MRVKGGNVMIFFGSWKYAKLLTSQALLILARQKNPES